MNYKILISISYTILTMFLYSISPNNIISQQKNHTTDSDYSRGRAELFMGYGYLAFPGKWFYENRAYSSDAYFFNYAFGLRSLYSLKLFPNGLDLLIGLETSYIHVYTLKDNNKNTRPIGWTDYFVEEYRNTMPILLEGQINYKKFILLVGIGYSIGMSYENIGNIKGNHVFNDELVGGLTFSGGLGYELFKWKKIHFPLYIRNYTIFAREYISLFVLEFGAQYYF